jgi:hypothetical protein
LARGRWASARTTKTRRRRSRPRGAQKAAAAEEDDDVMDGRETIEFYHSLQIWEEQAPPEMRGEAMSMMKEKVKAGMKPATITPKRGEKRAGNEDTRGESEETKEEEGGGDESEPGEKTKLRRKTMRQATRAPAAVTP